MSGERESRQRVLFWASKLFSEHAYGSVSIGAVARAADVPAEVLKEHFGTKRKLEIEVVRAMFQACDAAEPGRAASTSEQRLAQVIDSFLTTVAKNRTMWLAAVRPDALGTDPDVQAILERVRESTGDRLIEALGHGPAADASPKLRALVRSFVALGESATREWLQWRRLTRAELRVLLTTAAAWLVDDMLPLIEATAETTAASERA